MRDHAEAAGAVSPADAAHGDHAAEAQSDAEPEPESEAQAQAQPGADLDVDPTTAVQENP